VSPTGRRGWRQSQGRSHDRGFILILILHYVKKVTVRRLERWKAYINRAEEGKETNVKEDDRLKGGNRRNDNERKKTESRRSLISF
jgi:hypothetical protein